MKIQAHRAESGVLFWRDRCFWQLDVTGDHETTGADVEAFGRVILSTAKGAKLPLLIHRTRGSRPSVDALKRFARMAPQLLSAVAYWVESSEAAKTSRMVREAFLSLPVEVFTNEQDAVRWIREQMAGAEVAPG